jgi:hypothetical protein
MVQYCFSDFETPPKALQPCRRKPCSHHPETPDAVSSADFAFDQP